MTTDTVEKLYRLPSGTRFVVASSVKVPIESRSPDFETELTLDHIDGMYSLCRDDKGNIYHPAAWTEVHVRSRPPIPPQ
jgi:hypothetical protein